MGKGLGGGLLSSVVFVGLVALLVYFCCRVKRRKGAVLRGTGGNNVTNVVIQTGQNAQRPRPQCPLPPGAGQGHPYDFSFQTVPRPVEERMMSAQQMHQYLIEQQLIRNANANATAPPGVSHVSVPAFDDDKPPSYDEAIRQK